MIHDLFIIGGGINGCGIARDAAGRGLRVALAEMGDLGHGTSSRSTKLFHGGLRYLEYFELRLVAKALAEREVLLRAMPHIAWPMRFVLPLAPDMRFDTTTPALPSTSSRSAPVLNLDKLGQPLTFRSALAGPFGDQWRRANGNELVKLVATTRALTPVHTAIFLPTYLNNVVKEKWLPSALLRPGHLRDEQSDVDRRVRGTAGGDRLSVACPVSTAVASNPLVNCIFNATVSEDASFGTVDLTDFYLGTPNPNPPYLKVFLDQYPPEVLSSLHLSPFTKSDRRTGRPYASFGPTRPSTALRKLASSPTSAWCSSLPVGGLSKRPPHACSVTPLVPLHSS